MFTEEERGIAGVPISEWEELHGYYDDTHLRQSALDTVIGKIVSSVLSIKFMSGDKNLDYKLNYKPNENMNGSDFRTKLIKKLLIEGECLVVPIKNDLHIADSFYCDDTKEMKPYIYKGIVINNFAMTKTFKAGEVFHFKYHNQKLKIFLNELDNSYAKLFSRLIDVHMREQQLRVYAKFNFLRTSNKSQQEQFNEFQRYLNGIRNEINSESIAILPRQSDYDVEERSQSFLGRSVTELGDLENMYVKQVANALQVPPLLFSGDLADISQHKDSFVTYCIKPIIEIIATEVNAKYFDVEDVLGGKELKFNTFRILYNSELEMAKDVRTAVESAVWTIDDVNELLGKERENTELTTRRFITRNMAPLNEDGTMQM